MQIDSLAELVRDLDEARKGLLNAYQLDGSPAPVGNRSLHLSLRFSTPLGPQMFPRAPSATHP